ncbi:MAG: phosphoadenylyl-sulfate reductase [Arenimonas sp.]|nr:phosphoadenylyl-sulfate reductase [Arenimonas sp.]
MTFPDLVTVAEDSRARADLNTWLASLSAQQRVSWALESLAGEHAMTSSFGAQSAVLLHMLTQQRSNLPVILIDTGYLFPETYRFVDELQARLDLNLKIYSPQVSSSWNEARNGSLWESGAEGIQRYNQIHKVEPMQRALKELKVRTWFAGLRRSQSNSRTNIDFLELRDGRWKIHPLADWTDRDIWNYLQKHDLPYNPLWHQGYVSIGDTHTTQRWQNGMREEDTRFNGLLRECGIHN